MFVSLTKLYSIGNLSYGALLGLKLMSLSGQGL